MSAPLVFADVETTGLDATDQIWDFAAIRRDSSGIETVVQTYVMHDVRLAKRLPERFITDYRQRYDPQLAVEAQTFGEMVLDIFRPDDITGEKAHLVGAVPNFDDSKIAFHLLGLGLRAPWHYHLIDVENLVVGYLHGLRAAGGTGLQSHPAPKPPWLSNELSGMVGVDPEDFDRHTALGDAQWAKALYDAVTG